MPELLGFSFARPLWLLMLFPAAVLLGLLYQRGWRRSGWERLLPARLHDWLLQQHSGGSHALRFATLALTWALAILALAGPVVNSTSEPRRLSESALIIVLDVSRNMLSDDLAPDRLHRAKHKIRALMQDYPDHQLALVAFAGSAHRVTPLSRDRNTLESLLAAMQPDIMPAEGQNVDQALMLARQMLADQPQSTSQILLLTSGLDIAERGALATHAKDLGARLAILGIGTAAGAPVPLAEGGFMRDNQGRILLPRLNGQQLAAVARQHGSRYHGITVSKRDLDYLLLRASPETSADASERRVPVDQGHWLVLLLLPLAALGARRGWLGLLLVAALLPPPAHAFSWADLWQRPDQQAMQLLDQQPEAAAERFVDPAWRAWALYQAGDYQQAATAWEQLANIEPDNPDHHFNRGTAQAMAGQYQQALEAFEHALTRAPEHAAARHNRDIVETLLEKSNQQQEEQQADDGSQPNVNGETSQTSAPGANNDGNKSESADADNGDGSPPGTTPGGALAGNPQPLSESSLANDQSAANTTADNEDHQRDGDQRAALEQQQALQQWLMDIPDDPAELLRRKFLYQHLQQQESPR